MVCRNNKKDRENDSLKMNSKQLMPPRFLLKYFKAVKKSKTSYNMLSKEKLNSNKVALNLMRQIRIELKLGLLYF